MNRYTAAKRNILICYEELYSMKMEHGLTVKECMHYLFIRYLFSLVFIAFLNYESGSSLMKSSEKC